MSKLAPYYKGIKDKKAYPKIGSYFVFEYFISLLKVFYKGCI